MKQIKDYLTSEDPLLAHWGKIAHSIHQQYSQNRISRKEMEDLSAILKDENLIEMYSDSDEDKKRYRDKGEELIVILFS